MFVCIYIYYVYIYMYVCKYMYDDIDIILYNTYNHV